MLNMRYQKHGKVTPLRFMGTNLFDFDSKAVSIWLQAQKFEIRIGMRQRENEGEILCFPVSYRSKQGKNIYFCHTLQGIVYAFRGILPLRPLILKIIIYAPIGCFHKERRDN